MLLDDELAANGDHEKNAKPSAEKGERENAPEGELGAEAEEDEGRKREHHAGSERLSRGAGCLHDVVFEDRGAAERAQNADGQDGDRDGGRNREPSAQANVNGDCSKKQAEERAKNQCANGKFLERFFRGNVGAEFARRRRGTPGPSFRFFGHCSLLRAEVQIGYAARGGIMPQAGTGGKKRIIGADSRDCAAPSGLLVFLLRDPALTGGLKRAAPPALGSKN